MTWYILPSPFFSAMAFLPFCSSASLQAHAPPKTIEDGDTQEEDIGILLPDDMKETWVECKQTGHHAGMTQRLGSQVTVTQGRWLARIDLGVHAGLLQTRGDWKGVCISLLGSEEMLLEMSSDKFTWVAFCFQGCNTGCCLERPYI